MDESGTVAPEDVTFFVQSSLLCLLLLFSVPFYCLLLQHYYSRFFVFFFIPQVVKTLSKVFKLSEACLEIPWEKNNANFKWRKERKLQCFTIYEHSSMTSAVLYFSALYAFSSISFHCGLVIDISLFLHSNCLNYFTLKSIPIKVRYFSTVRKE